MCIYCKIKGCFHKRKDKLTCIEVGSLCNGPRYNCGACCSIGELAIIIALVRSYYNMKIMMVAIRHGKKRKYKHQQTFRHQNKHKNCLTLV